MNTDKNTVLIPIMALQKKLIIPAKAGIQVFKSRGNSYTDWMPAFAGMTPKVLFQRFFIRVHPCSSVVPN